MELVIKLNDEMQKVSRDIEYLNKDKKELSRLEEKIEELEPEFVLI